MNTTPTFGTISFEQGGTRNLERQARRHRVARSMSEWCRIILRCTDGIPTRVVADELGVHEHTVGNGDGDFLKIGSIV
jgi:hypothetical protein